MHCPNCRSKENHVIRTDTQEDAVHRQRQCVRCAWRWATAEVHRETYERYEEMVNSARKIGLLAGLVEKDQ